MHVLVLAALSGAVPVELVPTPTGKISAAFATIGIHGIALDASEATAEAMQQFLREQVTRAAEVREQVNAADRHLSAVEADVRATIRAARA
jgi:hypothetical protein